MRHNKNNNMSLCSPDRCCSCCQHSPAVTVRRLTSLHLNKCTSAPQHYIMLPLPSLVLQLLLLLLDSRPLLLLPRPQFVLLLLQDLLQTGQRLGGTTVSVRVCPSLSPLPAPAATTPITVPVTFAVAAVAIAVAAIAAVAAASTDAVIVITIIITAGCLPAAPAGSGRGLLLLLPVVTVLTVLPWLLQVEAAAAADAVIIVITLLEAGSCRLRVHCTTSSSLTSHALIQAVAQQRVTGCQSRAAAAAGGGGASMAVGLTPSGSRSNGSCQPALGSSSN